MLAPKTCLPFKNRNGHWKSFFITSCFRLANIGILFDRRNPFYIDVINFLLFFSNFSALFHHYGTVFDENRIILLQTAVSYLFMRN